jgi:hypothetical protein
MIPLKSGNSLSVAFGAQYQNGYLFPAARKCRAKALQQS